MKKYNRKEQMGKKQERKLKRAAKRLRRTMRAIQEVDSQNNKDWLNNELAQQKIIKEVGGSLDGIG